MVPGLAEDPRAADEAEPAADQTLGQHDGRAEVREPRPRPPVDGGQVFQRPTVRLEAGEPQRAAGGAPKGVHDDGGAAAML
jgi:hypothetical protein